MEFSLPKPGKVLIGAMVLLVAVWVMLGVGLNWGGADKGIFLLLVGSDAILEGEVWRLVTSFLVHQPSGPGSASHVLFSVIGLYFLGATLEERWGGRRFATFLVLSGVFASLSQVLVTKLFPALHQPAFFGALGVIDAIAIAWALSFRGQQVRLFFVLPISGKWLIGLGVVMNVIYIIGLAKRAPAACGTVRETGEQGEEPPRASGDRGRQEGRPRHAQLRGRSPSAEHRLVNLPD